ncbi:MAG: hypothetical protein LUQ07_04025 [Methanospirillum sp.]|nr:hypothetical protein [Methanospirillum sp.]
MVLKLFVFLAIISLYSVYADQVLYSSDFSEDPGWKTNSETSFYHDEESGRYHYLIEGGTGSYASYQLPDAYTGPFTLEFDVTPANTGTKSSFRLGLGKEGMDSQKGPLVLAELYNQNDEHLFSLTAISKENLRSQILSMPGKGSYSGKTIRFADGTTYHIKMTWYPLDERVSITVTTPDSKLPLFSHFVTVSGKMEDFTNLFLTSIGEGQNGMKAEGYIDNISLTALTSVPGTTEATPTATETPEITLVPTIVPDAPIEETGTADLEPEILPERTPLPAPPTPTPTQKAGNLPVLPIIAVLTLFGSVSLTRRR